MKPHNTSMLPFFPVNPFLAFKLLQGRHGGIISTPKFVNREQRWAFLQRFARPLTDSKTIQET
eukprot:161411-Amphidinium_carterae.1